MNGYDIVDRWDGWHAGFSCRGHVSNSILFLWGKNITTKNFIKMFCLGIASYPVSGELFVKEGTVGYNLWILSAKQEESQDG